MEVSSWMVRATAETMTLETRDEAPADREVLVEVKGCGVCHTDLGFYYDGVPTRHEFPLALGHEVSGTVVLAGKGAEDLLGKSVIVPAVIPCGECQACKEGHSSICPTQIFPGCDVHGGFSSHVKVPAAGLCVVPDLSDKSANPAGVKLEDLSVIADAVTTPYQAIHKSGLVEGDLAVFIGCGGVGGFGVQIANALGAHVVAIDVDAERLALMEGYGASLTLRADELDFKALRKTIQGFAKEHGIPSWHQKIFETSGTTQGQTTAFGLLGKGGHLGIVGFTSKKLELRLSNLMAFDARVEGNWGCPPEHYPAVMELVLSGKVKLGPFIEYRPLAEINEVFAGVHAREIKKRVILMP